MLNLYFLQVGCVAGRFACSVASANTIHFSNFTHSRSSSVDWVVAISDDSAGVLAVDVGIAGSSPSQFADITGLAFSIDGALPGGLSVTDLIDTTAQVSDFVSSYVGSNGKLGKGCGQVNFNGGTPNVGLFDAALGYASGRLKLTSISFTVDTLNGVLGLNDWTKFGVRGQSVGTNSSGKGSSKDGSTTVNHVHAPSPSAIVGLLSLALTGMLGYGWRKRRV